MQVVCRGRVHCALLSFAHRTSTSLGSAANKPQQSLFSTCPRRFLPGARSRFASPTVDDDSQEIFDLVAQYGAVSGASDFSSRQQQQQQQQQEEVPERKKAPSIEHADTQHSLPRDQNKCSSNSRRHRFSTGPKTPNESRPPDTPSSKYTRAYTRRRLLHGLDMWIQWGYLRHQHSGEDLYTFKKAFNAWKKRLSKIGNQTFPDRPWERDAEWLLEHDTVSAMRLAWQELDETTRRGKWPLLVLSAMRISPQRVHRVLEATMDSDSPGYAIHDSLVFIAHNMQLNKASTPRQKIIEAKEMMDFLRHVITDFPKGHIPFTQRIFGLFAKALPSEQAHELFTLLREHGFALHPNSLIQFASKFAASALHKEVAFQILRELSDAGADFNEARPSSVITSLLHCKAPEERGVEVHPSFNAKEALQYLLERGFTMNVLGATAFLDTLCQSGEVEEAIRLASLFIESGIQLDQKSWATIFRGAKGSLRMDNIAKALELAKAANVPVVDVLNNALHSAFLLSETERRDKRRPGTAGPAIFASLLRVYAKKFELEPLQWWLPESLPLFLAQSGAGPERQQQQQQQDEQGEQEQPHPQQQQQILVLQDMGARRGCWDFESTIIPFTDQLFSVDMDAKLRPSLTTIAIMLRAYIRSLQTPYDITTYYAFFKSRLEEQSRNPSVPSASRLITNQASLIHDTFILAMTDHPDHARSALEIFGDMLKDQMHTTYHKDGNDSTHSSRGRQSHANSSGVVPTSPIHPAPSVMTYTILLRGLMNVRHRVLAENILEVMREHNIAPNLVTWNTIISGYAYMQNVRWTVRTLQEMEATGLKPDMYTFKAFGRLHNQAKALQIMEHIINANREKTADGQDA